MKSETVRNSGRTTSEEITDEVSEEADLSVGSERADDMSEDMKKFRTPGFSRMRLDWRGPDRDVIQRAKDITQTQILSTFRDAFEIMNEIFEVVREAEVDQSGNPVRDQFGYAVWKRNPNGTYIEDWSKLARKEREHLLYSITTRLFDWEQRKDDLWAEAMFAKGQWEERFSIDYSGPMDGTIEDRTSYARIGAREERYFAILVATLSRKADSIVRVMNNLALRLRDGMVN